MVDLGPCEGEGCDLYGITLYVFGKTVSTTPFSYSSGGPVPDPPVTLCRGHAVERFGVEFSCDWLP